MKSKLKQTFNLIFFILITNIHLAKAHDSFNGGCKNHCKESRRPLTIDKNLNNIFNKNQIEYNYSCLNKSLCRG